MFTFIATLTFTLGFYLTFTPTLSLTFAGPTPSNILQVTSLLESPYFTTSSPLLPLGCTILTAALLLVD